MHRLCPDSFYGKSSNNIDYTQTISKLNNDLKLNKDLLNQKDKEINNLKNQLLNQDKTIKLLNIQISEKINELNNLKNKININDDDLVKELLPGEKAISALFISTDQNVTYSISCKNTTTFVKVEEKLYEEYPQYKETNNYFLHNGNQIKRFKTMEENKIKSGKPIILNIAN